MCLTFVMLDCWLITFMFFCFIFLHLGWGGKTPAPSPPGPSSCREGMKSLQCLLGLPQASFQLDMSLMLPQGDIKVWMVNRVVVFFFTNHNKTSTGSFSLQKFCSSTCNDFRENCSSHETDNNWCQTERKTSVKKIKTLLKSRHKLLMWKWISNPSYTYTYTCAHTHVCMCRCTQSTTKTIMN